MRELKHKECDHIWTEEFAVQFCWSCGAPRSQPKDAPASQPIRRKHKRLIVPRF